tara:strand:- start:844 stop:1335 length:492 start_codon:yes stop_codon:yes gene_type:complete
LLDFILNINNESLKIIFISMLPITELRFSIPYFILQDNIMWQKVLILSIFGNIMIGLLVLYIIAPLMLLLKKNYYLHRIISYILKRTKSKSRIIDNYKMLGLIFFVGIPLPLTGVWTGALASYLFSIPRKKSMLSIIIGVLISSAIVLSLTFIGMEIGDILKT